MNTKTFAQESRKILMQGVAKKLLYWGFNEKGEVLEQPEKISGGYSFRGDVFDDPSVPNLWQSLKNAIATKGIEVVVEEAAYTWFNRIMALRILTKNGYEEPQLENAAGLEHTPIILQKARQGNYSYLKTDEQTRLKKILTDYSKEQEAFAILLKGYCHSHKTLQRVFGKIDDYTELLLPDNMLQNDGFLHLLNTTDAISDDEYQKVELIGWLYQFYISEKKDDVFKSFKKGKKAEAKDIPAATQIFTPNWIVKYMVENTAGKIWLDKNPNSTLKTQMKYLVENDTAQQTVSSSAVENSIITSVADLTLIDPAAGSGHILVEGLDLIYKMYLEEYYTPEEAVESILKNNLFGLDIDDRAAQLATFAILLKAAKVVPAIWKKDWLPNVYAMPEAATFSLQEINDFLGEEGKQYTEELDSALQLMQQAKNLGSVMKLTISEAARTYIEEKFTAIKNTAFRDFNIEVIYQKLTNYIPVLLLLTKKYTSVVANPPYMGQKSMNADLKNYVKTYYPITKSDLMTIFMEVIPNMTLDNSRFALINLPSWLFLSSFEKIRKSYIDNFSFDSLLHMGRGIFGIDFGSAAFAIKKTKPKNAIGSYFRLHERNFQHILYKDIEKLFLYSNGKVDYKYDFNEYRGEEGITEIPENGTVKGKKLFYPNISQINFSEIPGNPVGYWISKNQLKAYLKKNFFTNSYNIKTGMQTGDNKRFVRHFYEVSKHKITIPDDELNLNSIIWLPYSKGGEFRKWFASFENIVYWNDNGKEIKNLKVNGQLRSRVREISNYFCNAISWNFVSSNQFSAKFKPAGVFFDVASSSALELDQSVEIGLAYLNSKVAANFLKITNPTLNYQVKDIQELPYLNFKEENSIKMLSINAVEISRKDWDSRETSWDFEKSPLLNTANSLEQAYTTWQKEVATDFFQLHKNEEELNKIFINIYGLQDELTPEVALKDITILQEELTKKGLEKLETTFRENGAEPIALPINKAEVISQFISYAIGLFMGRYRLDKPGLNIAHPNPTAAELASYTYNNGDVIIDEDAILPIMGTACNFPDDALQQIYNLLDVIWGAETRTQNINFIQECLNKELEKFLVADFYKYHCKMYKKKPIYWLFASKKGAFQVLVYMHRMNAFTVEKIRDNYLLVHIKNIESEISLLESNEASLSTQEAKKLDQLRKDVQECYEYEADLKDMADAQTTFDLDDGVTVNYKKFETIVAKIK
jgi:hypothetical protein